jgi:hypothetical protein
MPLVSLAALRFQKLLVSKFQPETLGTSITSIILFRVKCFPVRCTLATNQVSNVNVFNRFSLNIILLVNLISG